MSLRNEFYFQLLRAYDIWTRIVRNSKNVAANPPLHRIHLKRLLMQFCNHIAIAQKLSASLTCNLLSVPIMCNF